MIHCMQIKTGYKYNYTVLRGRTDNTSIVPVKGGRAGAPSPLACPEEGGKHGVFELKPERFEGMVY